MNKKFSYLIYILMVLIIITLSLPLILGLFAENRCKKIVGLIDTQTPLSAEIIEYKRGWFKAKAKAKISLDKLELKNKNLYQLDIVANINHGPMIIDWTRFHFAQAIINADIKLNTFQNQYLKREANNKTIANAKIKLKLNGKTKITLNSNPLNYHVQDKSLDWKGLKINATFSPLYNKIQSNINFLGFDLKNKEYILHIGEIISNYQGKKSSATLWIGERNLQIESFIAQRAHNRIIAFKKVNITNKTNESQNDSLNFITNINIDTININNRIYKQNILNFDINNIKQQALNKLSKHLVSKKVLTSPTSLGFDAAMTLLNNGTGIDIKKLNTDTPWGKALAKIKITFPDKTNNIGLLSTIANSTVSTNIKTEKDLALHLLEKFYQNIPSLEKQKDPAKRAETLLNEWQESGKVFTETNDDFLNINFDYKNNQLLINNKPLTLTTKL